VVRIARRRPLTGGQHSVEESFHRTPRHLCAGAACLIFVLGAAACSRAGNADPSADSATLAWTRVKKDTSGKTLKDLAGYKIHYGTSPTGLYTVVVLKDPHQTRYVVRGLSPGTWYFAVSAYTASGAEGAQSNVAAKTIR
jgi:hypothetical protein